MAGLTPAPRGGRAVHGVVTAPARSSSRTCAVVSRSARPIPCASRLTHAACRLSIASYAPCRIRSGRRAESGDGLRSGRARGGRRRTRRLTVACTLCRASPIPRAICGTVSDRSAIAIASSTCDPPGGGEVLRDRPPIRGRLRRRGPRERLDDQLRDPRVACRPSPVGGLPRRPSCERVRPGDRRRRGDQAASRVGSDVR